MSYGGTGLDGYYFPPVDSGLNVRTKIDAWPGGLKSSRRSDAPSTAINATDLIWDFFKQYSLP